MEQLKRVVIKQELVELTGDYKTAIVLNQMIYWSERRKDADKFLKEEIERIEKYASSEEDLEGLSADKLQSHGWIYKKADELSEETMIGVKPKAMLNYLSILVEKGWLDRRKNPTIKMDRTYQYRVNLLKIQQDLLKLGYALEGYKLPNLPKDNTSFPEENTNGQKENRRDQKENRRAEKENRMGEKEKAIPEITTETPTEIPTERMKEEEEGPSKLVQFLTSKNINLNNALEYESRVLELGLKDFTQDDVIQSLQYAFQLYREGKVGKPYKYAAGQLEFILGTKIENVDIPLPENKHKSSGYPRKGKAVRQEVLPDWFEGTGKEPKTNTEQEFNFEEEKRKLEEELKEFGRKKEEAEQMFV